MSRISGAVHTLVNPLKISQKAGTIIRPIITITILINVERQPKAECLVVGDEAPGDGYDGENNTDHLRRCCYVQFIAFVNFNIIFASGQKAITGR